MAAKGEMRFPFNDQRKLLTGFIFLATIAFVITGSINLLPFPDWIKVGTPEFSSFWFLLIGVILAIPRFTYYRHDKKDKPLS